MLKLYSKAHVFLGNINEYKNLKIESQIADGDKTLSFTYLGQTILQNEMYIRTDEDEYVIKEVPATTGSFPSIVCALNLEDLQKDMYQSFILNDTTIQAAAEKALEGTGWTIGTCDVTKTRNAGMVQVSTLKVIQNLATAFMCEVEFDTLNKKVSFYQQRGEDKGVYFITGLNLKKLQRKSTSYDYYTRLIPIGENGLTIESVNDGKNYLENFQYSDKLLTYLWKDESYTNATALKEDAELKLDDLSKPEKSYSVEVRNLAAMSEEYSILDYDLGDTIRLIDAETGTMELQRIKKLTRYPEEPDKDSCEIANTMLTFEEMQEKYNNAANIINYTVNGDGRYTGTISVSDILNLDKGVAATESVTKLTEAVETDIPNSIEEAKKVATNYVGVSDNGVIVGNLTDSKLGNNVLIDTDSVDIRSGETVLASYGAEKVYLGKNSSKSTIDLVNGAATISNENDSSTDYKRLKIEAGNSIALNTKNEIRLKSDLGNSQEYAYLDLLNADAPWDGSAGNVATASFGIQYKNITAGVHVYGDTGVVALVGNVQADYVSMANGFTAGGTASMKNVEISGTTTASGNITAKKKITANGNVETDAKLIAGSDLEVEGAIYSYPSNLIGGEKTKIIELTSSENLVIGAGLRSAAAGGTYIDAYNDVKFRMGSNTNYITLKPYWADGDTWSIGSMATAGYISNSGKNVYFTIPVDRPITNRSLTCDITVEGVTLRQGGKYLYGGSASKTIVPDTINAYLRYSGIYVSMAFTNTTNVVNNETVGIALNGLNISVGDYVIEITSIDEE